ncbi:MAG TPA: hypothetical protein VGH73_12645 [Thermoanaerobaculia bacterium]|jgi:hypothetical protein
MSFRHFPLLLLIGCLLAAVPSAAGVLEGNCRVANQPSATLLIPYFEVDLGDSSGQTTLFSINNASAKSALARVVLWTDWGVPTLAFDVYLTGYDVQTINLRDLFAGNVPATGPEASHVGQLSESNTLFDGCGNTGAAGVSPKLVPADVSYLRAAHTGQPVSAAPPAQCAGSGHLGTSVATGYITVDAVNRCSPRTVGTLVNTPANGTYFAAKGTGLASDENVLWGDYLYVNSRRNTSDGHSAVSIVADPDVLTAGAYTFYGRYVGFDGRDNRIPLSSLYYARYVNGGSFSGGTDLVVWRDNRRASVATQACGKTPDWSPLGEMQLVGFDEEENPSEFTNSNAFPMVTQKVHVGGTAIPVAKPYGWLMLDLWHKDSTHAQAWVGVIMTAEGRFSISNEAMRADDLCNFGP